MFDDGLGGSTLTFVAKDASGAAVSGLTNLTFVISGITGIAPIAAVESATKGTYTAKLTSTKAGTAAIDIAQAGVKIAGVAQVTGVIFTHKVGAIDASKSTLALSATTLDTTAPGAKVTVTFTAKDASGAAVTGLKNITFETAGTAAATSTVGTVSETAGVYSADVTGTAAGSLDITVSVGGKDSGVAKKTITLS